MTVSSTTNRITYNCEPPQKEFPFNFKILAEENLLVVLKDENDSETILVLNTDYSVNTGPWPNGGTVTTLAEDPYESGNTLTIIRQLPLTQGADYIEGDSFPAETHEEGLDRVVMLLQGLAERVLKLKTGSSYSDLTLPNPIAGRYLRWKEDLNGLENCAYFLNDINISDYMKTLLDDETAIAARNTLNLRHDNLPDVSPDDHHARYTDEEAATVADALIAGHALLPSIHHLKYTDAEARAAINSIFGADGKADADIDLDTHKLINVVDPVGNQDADTKKGRDDAVLTHKNDANAHHAQAHKDEHDPEDGADKLDTGGASWILGVQSPGTGAAHSFARSDHTHGIAHAISQNRLVTIDDEDAEAADYAKFTAEGLEGRSYAEVLADLGIEAGATADQTGEEIVALLEALIGIAKLSHDGGLSNISADDHHAQVHNAASHSDIASTGAQIDDAVSKKHAQIHASEHMEAGGDPVRLDELKQPTDVSTLNATTFWHGLMKKLSGQATEFLNGMGIWAVPPGGEAVYQHDFPDWSQIPKVAYDSGWFNLPGFAVSTHRIAHGIGSEPDLFFLWAKIADSDNSFNNRISLTPVMDSHRYYYGPTIVAFDETNVDVHANNHQMHWTDAQGRSGLGATQVRILGVTHSPGYNSGWVGFGAGNPVGTQITKAHGLGVVPDFYTLELSNNSDGSGHHIYAMEGNANFNGVYPTTVVDVDSTNIIFSVGTGNAYEFYDYSDTGIFGTLANWYYRVKAWSWTPSYTSSWTAVSTLAPREYAFQHGLAQIPFLALLEFSKASDGSDDIVPMIGHSEYSSDPYSHGLYISAIGENIVSIHNEDYRLASYEDSGGIVQSLESGYVRVKLWTA